MIQRQLGLWVCVIAVLFVAIYSHAGTWTVNEGVFVDQEAGWTEVLPAEDMDPTHLITWGPASNVRFYFSGNWGTPLPGDVGCWLYGSTLFTVWWQGVFNNPSRTVVIQLRSCDDNDGWVDIHVDGNLEFSYYTLNRGDVQIVGKNLPYVPHTVKLQTRMTGHPDDVSIEYVAHPAPVPTLTEWGLIILFLLLVASGIYVFYQRRRGVVPR